MNAILIIMRLTLREAARRKVLWGLIILGVLFLTLYWLGMSLIMGEMRESPVQARALQRIGGVNAIYNSFAMMALYAANFLTVMIAVLISIDTLSGEIGSGTIQSVAVKPLRRREIVLGKWLGFAILLGACSLFLIGGVLLITLLVTGYLPPNPASGLILMFLEALVFLSVSLLGGTRLSTLANGVIGFGLFGLAFIGAFIEQIGGVMQQFGNASGETAANIGKIVALVMPSETLWRRAVADMAEGTVNPVRMMTLGSSTPDQGVVGYALLYAAVLLGLAILSFQRRDL
jgi:ABC-type transport system involved in multi-copper enzyme maturation permease subunit